MWQERAVTVLESLTFNLFGHIKENYGTPQLRHPVFGPRFELETSRIRNKTFTQSTTAFGFIICASSNNIAMVNKCRRTRLVWHADRLGTMLNPYKICSKNLKRTLHFGALCIHWKLILKLISEKKGVTMCTRLNWLTITSNGWYLWTRYWKFRFGIHG
jgi:hypothetical protein